MEDWSLLYMMKYLLKNHTFKSYSLHKIIEIYFYIWHRRNLFVITYTFLRRIIIRTSNFVDVEIKIITFGLDGSREPPPLDLMIY